MLYVEYDGELYYLMTCVPNLRKHFGITQTGHRFDVNAYLFERLKAETGAALRSALSNDTLVIDDWSDEQVADLANSITN
jgi:hypothetical protein